MLRLVHPPEESDHESSSPPQAARVVNGASRALASDPLVEARLPNGNFDFATVQQHAALDAVATQSLKVAAGEGTVREGAAPEWLASLGEVGSSGDGYRVPPVPGAHGAGNPPPHKSPRQRQQEIRAAQEAAVWNNLMQRNVLPGPIAALPHPDRAVLLDFAHQLEGGKVDSHFSPRQLIDRFALEIAKHRQENASVGLVHRIIPCEARDDREERWRLVFGSSINPKFPGRDTWIREQGEPPPAQIREVTLSPGWASAFGRILFG